MPLNKAKGRMFKSVGWTWNPIRGCTHACKYCWAKTLCDRWGKSFNPTIQESAFKDRWPNDGTIVFVGSMGDLFCGDRVFREAIPRIFEKMSEAENQKFLLQTKNPGEIYHNWQGEIDDLDARGLDIYIGTTIETNRDTPWSSAPHPLDRFLYLCMTYENVRAGTFLSLEPLADFDLNAMITMCREISPIAIEIGLENYSHFLPKPPQEKTRLLVNELKKIGFEVILKENLRHLEETMNE